MDRIIALIDMDCFYVQVEQRFNPNLVGVPCAVVQYNEWRGGGLIAVNYEARDAGVSRYLRGDDAVKICPEIQLVKVPEVNGKADLTKYRDAGREVIDVISLFATCIERASVDEAYVDLTEVVKNHMNSRRPICADMLPNTYVVDWEEDDNVDQPLQSEDKETKRRRGVDQLIEVLVEDEQIEGLLVGAQLVEQIRAAVLVKTGFKCSAGISYNKMLSKLACGINKPNKQTIIPAKSVPLLFSKTSIKKIRNLGGKLGDSMQENGIEVMNDICKYSEKELQKKFGEKNGTWLHFLARGVDSEPVKSRQLPQSLGCSKLFNGKNALTTVEQVNLWLGRLATEIEMRLEKDQATNNRLATLLCIHVSLGDESAPISRSCPLSSHSAARITNSAYQILAKLNKSSDSISWVPSIVSLGMSATKFQSVESTSVTFMKSFFRPKSDEVSATNSDATDSANIDRNKPTDSPTRISFFSKRTAVSSVKPSMSSNDIQQYSAIAINPVNNSSEITEKLTKDNIDEEILNNLPEDLQLEINTHLNLVQKPEKASTSGIAKFLLTKSSLNDSEASSLADEDHYTCEKCQKLISIWKQFEHEDYHLAAEIQLKIQAEAKASTSVPQQRPKPQSPNVAKRKPKGQHNKGPAVKTRSISTYFKKESSKNS